MSPSDTTHSSYHWTSHSIHRPANKVIRINLVLSLYTIYGLTCCTNKIVRRHSRRLWYIHENCMLNYICKYIYFFILYICKYYVMWKDLNFYKNYIEKWCRCLQTKLQTKILLPLPYSVDLTFRPLSDLSWVNWNHKI